MATYVGLGLTEEVFFYRRRREEERAAKEPQPVVLEADGGAKTDEEVLEELGAYDVDEREGEDVVHANIISDDEARIAELDALDAARRRARHQDRGASATSPRFYVPAALHRGGVEIVPVPVYYPESDRASSVRPSTVASPTCPGRVDIVDVFRRAARRAGARRRHPGRRRRARSGCSRASATTTSAERFAAAGILVVQERCLMVDWQHYARR